MKLTDLIDNLILLACCLIIVVVAAWSVDAPASDAGWVACQKYGKGPVVAHKYFCPAGWEEV